MIRRLLLLAVALAGLISSGGCSLAISHMAARAGHETAPRPSLSLAREQLDGQLGAPIAVAPLPDGGQLATYRYRQHDPKAEQMARASAAIHVGIGYATQGYGWILLSPIAELVLTPLAIYHAATPPRGEVQFTISPDGLLLGYGRPPGYGPEDATVEPPSLGAIRRTCWASDGDDVYVECVAGRFAVWSIE